MATEAPKAKRVVRRNTGPKPVFMVVRYTDENGQAVTLDKSRLTIALERSAEKILDLVTGGEAVTVVKGELPAGQPRKPAAPAA